MLGLGHLTDVAQAAGTALLLDAPGALAVSVAIVGMFVGTELASRWLALPAEWTRKATHVGSGVIVMSFPWLFASAWTVLMLAVSFAGVLIGGRITGLLGSIHNVERSTGGAYYYPFAVLGVWLLSGGDALLYCVPLAIMAVADTGAALVGKHAGQTVYRVMDGQRSVEGSLAFFGLAFGIVLVGGALAGRPGWPAALLVTLVVAVLTTAVEAVSVRGGDNLAIPYAAWLALDHTERLGLDALGDWIIGMGLGLVVVAVTARRARLDPAGGVMVFLVCTLSYALGGVVWFAPLAALYSGYLVARGSDAAGLDRVFPTTAGAMVIVLLFAHTAQPHLYVGFVASVCASAAMGAFLVARRRGWPVVPMIVLATGVPAVTAWAVAPQAVGVWPAVAGLVAVGLLWVLRAGPRVGRRALISLATGLSVWWLT